jgi:hypothetical protein
MKKSTLLITAITISSSILLSSCGVMFGGSKYNANIKVKDHPNAEIYANGEKIGTGEVSTSFKRNQPLKVEVKQDKCQPKTKNFDNSFRTGNFILSAISWGLVGIAVDLGTGASYKPDHKNDPDIEKLSDKNYKFTVDYSECKEK